MRNNTNQLSFFTLSFLWIWVWFFYPNETGLFVFLTGFLFTYNLLNFLDNLNHRVIILDLLELLAIMQWLFFPALYYFIYKNNLIQWKWWYLQMQVPIYDYFILAFPSTLGLIFGIKYFKNRYSGSTQHTLINLILTNKVANNGKGLALFSIGVVSQLLKSYVPISLDFILTLMSNLVYIGILYIYFSDVKYKKAILFLGFFWILYQAIRQGMFGIAIWWPAMVANILIINKRFFFIYKIAVLVFVFVSFSLLQSVKTNFRSIVWLNNTSDQSNFSVLQNLINEEVEKEEYSLMSWEAYYPFIGRMNQGYHVTMAQKHTPSIEPYCYGETIFTAILASLVPRLVWHDKPKAGGKINYKRFTGVELKSASMNIGQLGDAYVNFTPTGAPLLLYFYGLFVSSIFYYAIKKALIYPDFLLWIPLLFSQLLSVETDFLTTINGALKSSIFCIILFWLISKKNMYAPK